MKNLIRFGNGAAWVRASVGLLLVSLLAWGQLSTARLEGLVTDQSGSVIPAATVTVSNVRTGTTASMKTNEQGRYIFPSLQPSIYRVQVEANGFRKSQIENIELNVATQREENITLEVGSVAESVTVEATAVRVDTSNAQMGRAVTLKEVDTLPQLGRAPLGLVSFTTGVSINPGDTTFSRINGMRQGSNNTKLDGIDANDSVAPRLGLSLTAVNTDSVEELRVITNGAKAEYGRNAGGQVEMITRSGRNQFYGNAWDYMRNTVLNANRFFSNAAGVPRPKFIQNIFGGSVGGPVWHDKAFFFFNYQGRRTAQDTERNRTVLTQLARNGIFQWRTPGTTTVNQFNILTNDPAGIGMDPQVKSLIGMSPLPNNLDIGDGLNTGGFRFNNPSGGFENQYTVRGDYNLMSNNRIFFRYSHQNNESIDALNNADAVFPGLPQGAQGGTRWGYSAGSDWVIKPTLINEFRIGYQSATVAFLRPARLKGPQIIPNYYTNPILPNFAQGRNSPVIDFADNLTWVKGKMTWKMGVVFRRTLQYGYNDANAYPNITLARTNGNVPASTIGPNGAAVITTGDRQNFENLYNDLLGLVNGTTVTYYSNLETFQPAGTPRVRNLNFHDWGAFVQSDYKILPNLVLNFGLRWELFGSPVELDNYQGTVNKVAEVNTVGRVIDFKILRTGSWYNNDFNNFAPRFGFSWDPKSDGKTAIRGSYGLFYDRNVGATSSLVDGNTPGFAVASPRNATLDFPVGTRVSQNPPIAPVPSTVQTVPDPNRRQSIVLFPESMPTGYASQWNFGVQREIARNFVVDVAWVGTYAVKQFMWLDQNQPRVYGQFLTDFKELAAFNATGAPVSPNNSIARIYGSAAAALSAIGATQFSQGQVGAVADTIDLNRFTSYPGAGLDQYYIRNFPQFNQVIQATNNGRTRYNSLQLSLRRSAGSLKMNFNYTYSKAMDNGSVDGNGFTAPINNWDAWLNWGRGEFDRPHVANASAIYSLPFGKGRKWLSNSNGFVDGVLGGWDIGGLFVYQSGSVYSISSGRRTGPSTLNTWVNYSGDTNIGQVEKRGNGVWYFTAEDYAKFSFPGAGEIGNSGRNAFRGPTYFNVDLSIVKRFTMPWERQYITFRAEMYNALNTVNFGLPGATLTTGLPNFGRISAIVGDARIMQMALRYDF